MSKESRKHPRHRVAYSLRVGHEMWRASAALQTSDLGRGGVFIETHSPPPAASQIHIDIAVPGEDEPISFVAHVVHVVSYARALEEDLRAGFGAEFDDPDPAALQRLGDLLASAAS